MRDEESIEKYKEVIESLPYVERLVGIYREKDRSLQICFRDTEGRDRGRSLASVLREVGIKVKPSPQCSECNQQFEVEDSSSWNYCPKCREEKDRYRSYSYRTSYGITLQQWEEMFKAQEGKCWFCGTQPQKRRLCVDHDHITGRVRGLLCNRCNACLGWFEAYGEKIGDYLEHLVGDSISPGLAGG